MSPLSFQKCPIPSQRHVICLHPANLPQQQRTGRGLQPSQKIGPGVREPWIGNDRPEQAARPSAGADSRSPQIEKPRQPTVSLWLVGSRRRDSGDPEDHVQCGPLQVGGHGRRGPAAAGRVTAEATAHWRMSPAERAQTIALDEPRRSVCGTLTHLPARRRGLGVVEDRRSRSPARMR